MTHLLKCGDNFLLNLFAMLAGVLVILSTAGCGLVLFLAERCLM